MLLPTAPSRCETENRDKLLRLSVHLQIGAGLFSLVSFYFLSLAWRAAVVLGNDGHTSGLVGAAIAGLVMNGGFFLIGRRVRRRIALAGSGE